MYIIQEVWAFLSIFGLFWKVWACLNIFEHFWICLNMFDILWTCLNMFEHFWTSLNIFERVFDSLASPPRCHALPARPGPFDFRASSNQHFERVVWSPEEKQQSFRVCSKLRARRWEPERKIRDFALCLRVSHLFNTSRASLGARQDKSGISHFFNTSRALLWAREKSQGFHTCLTVHVVGTPGEKVREFTLGVTLRVRRGELNDIAHAQQII